MLKVIKKEGLITIEFQSIDAIIGKDKNMSDLTSYGATVKLKREGEKDLYFKAKDGNKFCIGERCFLGAKGSEDGFFWSRRFRSKCAFRSCSVL